MGKGSKAQTTGYRYSMSLQMGLGRGPINELVEIRVADNTAWAGSSTGGDINIDAANLFGGDAKEGGIKGLFRLFMGGSDQVYPADIKGLLTGLVPDFRGVATAFFDGLVCSGNPYPKEWKFRLRRQTAGWYNDNPWRPDSARIPLAGGAIQAMNPAHIIYECATNPEWGRGLDPAQIDDATWSRVASVLLAEGTGLCLQWTRQDDLDSFVQTVLDHIAGALYVSRITGLLTLSLIRADYDPATLFTYDLTNGLLSVDDDDGSSSDQAYNEIIVQYHDPISNADGKVRAQNIAAFQATKAFVSTTKDYPGFPTKDLAAVAAARELQVSASMLKRFKVHLDRRAWKIEPASVFAINYNGTRLILRAVTIDDGSNTDGKITVSALQDVFGLPSTSYVRTQPVIPSPAAGGPADAPLAQRVIELNYRDLVRELSQADLQTVTPDQAFVGSIAQRPTSVALSYELETAAAGETLAPRAQGNWTPAAKLGANIGPYDTAATFTDATDLSADLLGEVVLIDNEICRVDALDPVAGTLTIARGCVDTLPAQHALGTRLWWFDDDLTPDERTYAIGETVSAVMLTRTSTGMLSLADAPVSNVVVAARQGRPYPPGDVRVNGTPIFSFSNAPVAGDIMLTWTHRDRTLELDQLVEHGADSVGPEAGVTYTVRVLLAGVLETEFVDIPGPAWSYTQNMALGDGDPATLILRLWSSRDGIESLYPYEVTVNRVQGGAGTPSVDTSGQGEDSTGGGSEDPTNPTPGNGGVGSSITPAPATARYWRISNLLPQQGAYVGTNELTFYNQSGAKIASAAPFSNGADTDPVENVNDNDKTTYWTTNDTGGGGFVGLDLGEGAKPYTFSIGPRPDYLDSQAIKRGMVEYAEDKNGVWTPVIGFRANVPWQNDSQVQTFSTIPATRATNLVAARYWRIDEIFSSDPNYAGVGELQFLDANGNVFASFNPLADANPTDDVKGVNDDDLTTFWTSGYVNGQAFVGLDFLVDVQPHSVRISVRDGAHAISPTKFNVSYSENLQGWTTFRVNLRPAAWTTDGQQQTFALQG